MTARHVGRGLKVGDKRRKQERQYRSRSLAKGWELTMTARPMSPTSALDAVVSTAPQPR